MNEARGCLLAVVLSMLVWAVVIHFVLKWW